MQKLLPTVNVFFLFFEKKYNSFPADKKIQHISPTVRTNRILRKHQTNVLLTATETTAIPELMAALCIHDITAQTLSL